ncbi:MAG: FAD-dependent oxidoreductase [Pseudoflavonifractor sp.]
MYDLIVIGAGPAGLTAALYARRAGYSVLVLEGGVPGGQAVTTPHVENWPGTPLVAGPDFAMNLYAQTQSLGAEFAFAAATGLRVEGKSKLVLAGETQYEARAVVFAGGVRRRRLEVPGEEAFGGRGVSYCATCDGGFFKGKDVAVVGGGNTALEDAVYLAALCPTVWLVHRKAAFTGQKYLEDSMRTKPNIKLLMDHKVLEIQGDNKVNALRLMGPDNQRILHVAGVFVAVGLMPDCAAFAPPLALDAGGYIMAGEDCTTNVPGVFVAGDCRTKELRQLVTAAADGAMAAAKAGQYLAATL